MVEEVKKEYKHDMIVLRTAVELSINQIRINKEPKDHLITVKEVFEEALETNRMTDDEEFRTFVCTKASDLISRMAKEISHDEKVSTSHYLVNLSVRLLVLGSMCRYLRCLP